MQKMDKVSAAWESLKLRKMMPGDVIYFTRPSKRSVNLRWNGKDITEAVAFVTGSRVTYKKGLPQMWFRGYGVDPVWHYVTFLSSAFASANRSARPELAHLQEHDLLKVREI